MATMNNLRYRWQAPTNFDDVVREIEGASSDQHKLDVLFETLIKYQPLLSYAFGRGSVYWRGRRSEKESGFETAKELGPPPAATTNSGRLNDPGQPILYSSTRTHAVFNELNVEEGDYIHLVGIRIKPNTGFNIMAVGELFHIFKTGRSRFLGDRIAIELNRKLNNTNANVGRRLVYVDALLDSYLADPRARDREYCLTRAIARAIFKKVDLIEAFFYPSVRQEAGMNLAVQSKTYDTKMHIVASQVVRITRRREHLGLYDYEVCCNAEGLKEDGSFQWLSEEQSAVNRMVLFGLTKEEEELSKSKGHELTGNDYLDLVYLHS